MKIYLAARYGRREELVHYRGDLAALGHLVTSRWLDGAACPDDGVHLPGSLAETLRIAEEDFEDLRSADLLISFTEPAGSRWARGSRHVEFGLAYAMGLETWIVGGLENVFHALPNVRQFGAWGGALCALGNDATPPVATHRGGQASTPRLANRAGRGFAFCDRVCEH